MATLMYKNVVPKKIYYKNTEVKKVYYNNVKVWESQILVGTLAVGNTVTFDGMQWLVVHNDTKTGYWYLAYATIYSIIQWAVNNSHNSNYGFYSTSKIKNAVDSFENKMSTTAKSYMQSVGTKDWHALSTDNPENITTYSKVFVPTRNNTGIGGFTQYKSADGRIATYNGNACAWWLSSGTTQSTSGSSTGVDTINEDGTISRYGGISANIGFRPHICITKP